MYRKISLTFFLSLTLSLFAYSQQIVKGTILDSETGEALIGAAVLAVGSDKGTATDFDGSYTLAIPEGVESLIISYTGYTDQKILIDGRKTININLEQGVLMDEVVVVGYGEQSKTKVTAAISTIDEKVLKKIPVPAVSNALEGLAPGLFVRQFSGEPGFSGSSFEIRNFGNALVIVDGSPGNIDNLDPNEIESISILKDAAAAAVYGVQGGNGVVLVTTKKGTIKVPELNYSNQFTSTAFTTYPDFFNSIDYATTLNEGLVNSGQTPFYSEEEVEKFRSGSDPINYPDEDWRDLVFRDWGFQQRHNLNYGGGNEKIKYFVSAGFLDQGSNYTEDVLSFQQYNFRTNITANIKENLTLQANLAGSRLINEAPGFSAFNIFRELSRALPTDIAYYPDGTPARPSFSPHHIQEAMRDFNSGYYRARSNNVDAKLSLEWDVRQLEGLTLKTYGSLLNNNFYTKVWGKSYNLYTLNRQTGNYDSFVASPEARSDC